MAYQVLARKWRPQVFEDVVGQEHITDVLMNSITTARIHHGYVFSGIRGIGKTTTARILAKALNCAQGPTPHPCNACEFCHEITIGASMDVEEIDGASNRGVEDVRIVQDNVGYAPSRSRYKIFIIDEVHMLTTPAFNALLKTLEEPPAQVVFIMATTEPWKIPVTILSRCQQFKFRNGTATDVIALLRKIARHEQMVISDASLALIAKTAGGSVRDAENLLDQVTGFCGQTVHDQDVRYVLGIPEQAVLLKFLKACVTHQTALVFTLIDELIRQGCNFRLFCLEMLERLRNLAVLKTVREPDVYMQGFDYTYTDLMPYAAETTVTEIQQMYWLLAEAQRAMIVSPQPRLILEMTLARMTKVQALPPIAEIYRQLQEISAALAAPMVAAEPADTYQPMAQPAAIPAVREEAATSGHENFQAVWFDLLTLIKQQSPALLATLKIGRMMRLTAQECVIGFHEEANASRKRLEEPKNLKLVTDMLRTSLGRSVRVTTAIDNEALSVAEMQAHLDQQGAPLPRPTPENRPAEFKPRASSAEQSARKFSGGDDRSLGAQGNWQKAGSGGRYKPPPAQVSVQELVRLFEGKIEA